MLLLADPRAFTALFPLLVVQAASTGAAYWFAFTQSQSRSPSQMPSWTPSPTATASTTASMTRSPDTLTQTPTASSTPSVTASYTPSQSMTLSQTPSPGATPSALHPYVSSIAASGMGNTWDVAVDGAGGFFVSDIVPCLVYHLSGVGAAKVIAAGTSGSCTHAGADGTASTLASLARPVGLAAYSATDFLVAEGTGNYVRRSTAGIIRTIVGTGAATSTGDGGPAVAASINSPAAIRFDATGAGIYIAEDTGSRVRYVSAAGVISTAYAAPAPVTCAAPNGVGGL